LRIFGFFLRFGINFLGSDGEDSNRETYYTVWRGVSVWVELSACEGLGTREEGWKGDERGTRDKG
jgi:hypothetical protein